VPNPLVLAHRGANREAPENTVGAFARALDLGADGVELDVHRTTDGGLVVNHDAAADGIGVLAEAGLDVIRSARPDIPTLEEALDVCIDHMVNIEIKNLPVDADYDPEERTAELVVELLTARDLRDHVIVSSFNPTSIERVHGLDERVPTGFLVMHGLSASEALDVAHQGGHAAVHPFVGLLAGRTADSLIERAHSLGIQVNPWTVNDPAEIRRLGGAGVDAVITDTPTEALAALSR
jgi:glycerophosphoryl diester phosphodiesterase